MGVECGVWWGYWGEGRQLVISEMSVKETAIKLICKPLIILLLGWVNVEQIKYIEFYWQNTANVGYLTNKADNPCRLFANATKHQQFQVSSNKIKSTNQFC